MGRDFFIADIHFGDERILHYEQRPFDDIDEMEEKLIQNWNESVREEDRVYVLGDFSSETKEKNKEILNRLSGQKILIMGNHDCHITPKEWQILGFSMAIPWPILYRGFYLLSHEPLYLNQNMPYANLFGHVHNSPQYRDVSHQSFCVSAERISYQPISWETIVEKMKNIE